MPDTGAALVWDVAGERTYEAGTKKGVLWVQNTNGTYGEGVAWDGLVGVTQSPSGAEEQPMYADDIKYAAPRSKEEFGGTIECFKTPEEFDVCDGTSAIAEGVTVGQQGRKSFAFSYQSTIGNDTDGFDYGYKIHLIYGATASPSEKAHSTINESPEGVTFSYEFTTLPVEVPGFKPTSIITIDSTKVDSAKLTSFEAIIYGSTTANSRLPMPDEVATHFA